MLTRRILLALALVAALLVATALADSAALRRSERHQEQERSRRAAMRQADTEGALASVPSALLLYRGYRDLVLSWKAVASRVASVLGGSGDYSETGGAAALTQQQQRSARLGIERAARRRGDGSGDNCAGPFGSDAYYQQKANGALLDRLRGKRAEALAGSDAAAAGSSSIVTGLATQESRAAALADAALAGSAEEHYLNYAARYYSARAPMPAPEPASLQHRGRRTTPGVCAGVGELNATGGCWCPLDRTGDTCASLRPFVCTWLLVAPALECRVPEAGASTRRPDALLDADPVCIERRRADTVQFRFRAQCNWTDGGATALPADAPPFVYAAQGERFALTDPVSLPVLFKVFNFNILSDLNASLWQNASAATLAGLDDVYFDLVLPDVPLRYYAGGRLYIETAFPASALATLPLARRVDRRFVDVPDVPRPKRTESSLSGGAIAGIVVGTLLGLAGLAYVALLFVRRVQRRIARNNKKKVK